MVLSLCTWYDNKRVIKVSKFVGKEPIRTCSHYDRKERKCIELTRLASIKTYNQYTGGTSKADMMQALYKNNSRYLMNSNDSDEFNPPPVI